jgi:hypothetical protein
MNACYLCSVASAVLILSIAELRAQVGSPPVTPKSVTIVGQLKSRIAFGRPGFGETPRTDQKVQIYYVELAPRLSPEQLHLRPGGGAKVPNSYSKVQLWCGDSFETCESFLRSHVGKTIIVSGITAYALEAYDFYPVTMTVTAIDTK